MNVKRLNDSEKIVEILQYFNLKKSEFSTKTGMSTQQIFDLIRGQIANLSRENMEKIISAYPEISPFWLITGEGDMIVNNTGIIQHPPAHERPTDTLRLQLTLYDYNAESPCGTTNNTAIQRLTNCRATTSHKTKKTTIKMWSFFGRFLVLNWSFRFL